MGLMDLILCALMSNPGLLAPGAISSAAHEGAFALTPDGQSIYFTRFGAGMTRPEFFVSDRRDGRWSEARRAGMPEGAVPAPFSFSPDGGKLFYSHAKDGNGRVRLWVAERDGGGWKNARPVGGALEKWDGDQVSPSVTADGTLYFSSNPRGAATWDIYRSALKDGQYADPELLGGPQYERISSPRPEQDVAVSADGKRLVFSSAFSRNGQGGADLFLAELPPNQRTGAWTWTLAAVNTAADETNPQLSPDGKRLYFCRGGDIHEVDLERSRGPARDSTLWKRRADLPSVRQWPQAAVSRGRIYVYGGRGVKGWVHQMDVYDPETDSWSPAGSGPEGWTQAVLASAGDRLFLIRRGAPGMAEYRPELKRWEVRAAPAEFTLPEGPPMGSRTVVDGRKAYTMFASGELRSISYFAECDLKTGAWRPLRSMPAASAQMAAFEGRIYAFGQQTFVYDPSVDQWTEAASMGIPRFETAPAVVGDEIWLIGGHGVRDEGILGDITPDILRFDLQRNQWRPGPALPWQRWGSAAIQVNGRLFVIGGIRPGPVWSADQSVFEYTPKTKLKKRVAR
jgi:hypothetical protein